MEKKNTLKITFLGTGTSQGVPVIACKCPVCKSTDVHDKRLRSSILIEKNDTVIVIDTGPDFRYQLLRANVEKLDAVFFTHAHKDHTAGLDDIRSFNFIQKKPMPVYCEENVLKALKREFIYIFEEHKYPGIPEIIPHIIEPDTILKVGDIDMQPIRILHMKLPILGFRIDNFAYITDADAIPEYEMEKLKGLKVLVINALRKMKHISHFNLERALQVIDILKPEQAYLTHISHLMGLHMNVSKELPSNIALAYDKLEVRL